MPFLAGNALLGTIGVFVHMAQTSALTATWFRCAFGLLGLTVWFTWRRQLGALRPTRSTAPWLLLAAALMVIGWGLFFSAIERTSAGVAVVLYHTQPMWVMLLGALWLHERPGKRSLAAVSAAMAGLFLATGVLEQFSAAEARESHTRYWAGVAFCLLGAFLTACVTVTARRLRELPAGVLAWWQCAVGAAVLWVWPMQHGWPALGTSWLWLAGLGLIHTGLAYTWIYAGMARLGTGRIAVLQFAYPAVAILIDWQFFDRRLSGLQMAGIALMGLAIWYAQREARARAGRCGEAACRTSASA
ncbi:DMT family transporter [Comamonas endophytica]|uniref:DMT family transporter n=1 Tax=Comamonas endophytica TaxID=2949090 RepID=UPI003613525C